MYPQGPLRLCAFPGCHPVKAGGTTAGSMQSSSDDSWSPRSTAASPTSAVFRRPVNGCFILGLDGHDESIFDAVHDFVQRTELFDVQITVLTPFPGTPLYQRLEHEGRLLEPAAWNRCTLFDANFQPRNMTPQTLARGLRELGMRLYNSEFTTRRRRRFHQRLESVNRQGRSLCQQ